MPARVDAMMCRFAADKFAWMAVALLVVGLGCEDSSLPAPPPSAGDPAVTEEAITAEIEKGLQPLYDFVPILTRQTPVPPAFAQTMREHLRQANEKYHGTPEGKEALRNAVRHLEDVLVVAREKQNGLAVLLICELIRIVEPNNSRVARYEEWATIEKNRPVVMLRGWFVDEEKDPPVINAFIEVFLPETGEVEHLRAREGEEFLGLKFRKILGKRRGMLLEYLKTGDLFEVYLRSWP
ncbi:MAG: hypothetical protein AMXMBFR82_46720 [Candidatus Hydrogenedentota bacterium]